MKRQELLMVHSLSLWNIALPWEEYSIPICCGLKSKLPFLSLCHIHSRNGGGVGSDSLSQNGSNNRNSLKTDEADVSLNQNMCKTWSLAGGV